MVSVERLALIKTGTAEIESSESGTVIFLDKKDASTSALSLFSVARAALDLYIGGKLSSDVKPC